MTLTLYAAHILFLNLDDDYTPTTSFVIQVLAALAFGLLWWSTAGRGPLETLTAALAHRARRLQSPDLHSPGGPDQRPVNPANSHHHPSP